jgi:hypothetical protein
VLDCCPEKEKHKMKATDLKTKPPNILIGGPAGSGKTCLVAQASGGYLMDFDGHMKDVLPVKDKFSPLRNSIEFDEFVDRIDMVGGTVKLLTSKYLAAKARLLSCAEQSYNGKWPFDALIIDSITGLCRAISLHVMACAGNPFKKPQIQHFGDMINEIESILTIIRSMPVLKLTTAHEMILFGTKDEHIGTRLMSATKPHGANKLAWLFDQVLMAKKRFRGQGKVDYIVTGKHEIAKGPITDDVVHNEIGLKGVLEKLEYSYG